MRKNGGVKQNLLVAKSRVSSKNLTIPRLELITAHTLAKLVAHVRLILTENNFKEINLWTDSMATLYWLLNRGTWSRYVRNRVKAIKDLGKFTWRYVPTDQNPSDLGTRGILVVKLNEFWFKGPNWLSNEMKWPKQPEIVETTDATEEIIATGERMLLEQNSDISTRMYHSLLTKFKFSKLLRITAFIKRFIYNCLKARHSGALITKEIKLAELFWIKVAQIEINEEIKEFQLRRDQDEIFRCYGKVSFYHPIFIPRRHVLAEKIVEMYHEQTIHGGVQTTMSKVRERFWIPRLRTLVKSVRYKCSTCKRINAKGLSSPLPAMLPKFREEFSNPFATTGVDFAGPLHFKMSKTKMEKAYIALFTCAATRAVHLKLCENLKANCFKRALKEFVARRGVPNLIVSDNEKTFKTTAGWLKKLSLDEDIQCYLAKENIEWKFNLSRAPWWGGFFERLIGITKNALSKAIGRALLTFQELEEILLDIECFMNNRPLAYLDEEFEQRAITPNILIHGKPTTYSEESDNSLETVNDVSRRIRYLKRCRNQLKKRWANDYIKALTERRQPKHEKDPAVLDNGRVILYKDYLKDNQKWKLGKIIKQIKEKDSVFGDTKLRQVMVTLSNAQFNLL